jgi:signal transduction histidine kinase
MQTHSLPYQLADEAVLDRLPVAVYVCDRQGRIVRFNDRAVAIWGRRPGPDDCYCGSHRLLGLDGGAVPPADSPVAESLPTGLPLRGTPLLIERPDASRVTVLADAVPILDDLGELVGAAITLREVAALMPSGTGDGERARNELLAMVAHELRQPIHAATAALGVMSSRLDRAHGLEARATVERQIQQMNRIVEDLLNTDRIARGDLELRRQVTDLRPTVRQVADAVRPLLVARGQQFDVVLPQAPVPVSFDEARMQQVLMNVLTNAAKYTSPGGRVSLTLTNRGRTVDVKVADNGRGIDPAALTRIFDLFTRDAEDARGFGVGLAVAKRLVELHGGTIQARSGGQGQGSEFLISLPAARAE